MRESANATASGPSASPETSSENTEGATACEGAFNGSRLGALIFFYQERSQTLSVADRWLAERFSRAGAVGLTDNLETLPIDLDKATCPTEPPASTPSPHKSSEQKRASYQTRVGKELQDETMILDSRQTDLQPDRKPPDTLPDTQPHTEPSPKKKAKTRKSKQTAPPDFTPSDAEAGGRWAWFRVSLGLGAVAFC